MPCYRVYGFALDSNHRFQNFLTATDEPCTLSFVLSDRPPYELGSLEPIYSGQLHTSDGRSVHRLFRLCEREILRVANVGDFLIQDELIECRLHQEGQLLAMEAQFLGTVLAYWLERRGISALHCSAVEIEDRAVGFLAASHGGKSALAAEMIQHHGRLLTDDILPVLDSDAGGLRDEGAFFGAPGYPQFRMWPAEAEHFYGSAQRYPVVHPGFSKRRIRVPDGQFCSEPKLLCCLYLPIRRTTEEGGRGIQIESLAPGRAAIELVRNSFVPRLVAALGWEQRRLDSFARLVRQVAVRRLSYPAGLMLLSETCSEILADLETLHVGDQHAV